MRHVLFAALMAAGLQGAAIRGLVVDNLTGRPVARAMVVVQPIAGTSGTAQSARSDLTGAFDLPGLASGAWLLVVHRRGFAPTHYPKGPIRLVDAATAEVNIRLRRFGAIIGTVLDGNDVGLQDHDVVAYRNVRPPVLVGKAKTDDRGVYRIVGLQPGSYFVRSVGGDYDEGSYLPTFSRQSMVIQGALPIEVKFDDEIAGVDIRPFPGRLVRLSGRVSGRGPTTVYLISDTGTLRVGADASGRFSFPPVSQGQFEIFAQSRDTADWQQLNLYRDTDIRLTLAPFPDLRMTIADTAGQSVAAPVLVRRVDLAVVGNPEVLRSTGRVLPPGRYEFSLAPSTTHYAAGVRRDGWMEVPVVGPGPADVKFTLSDKPATLRGLVRNAAREPVAGASVNLAGLRTVLTDINGQFEFYGLAPGAYRVAASFDTAPDAAYVTVNLEEGQDRSLDLDLYVAR